MSAGLLALFLFILLAPTFRGFFKLCVNLLSGVK